MKSLETELRSVWKGSEKMVQHCLKSSKYVEIGGWFVDVCASKPSITTRVWYDDETDGPDNNKETFMWANRYNKPRLYDEDHKHYIRKQYWSQTDEALAGITTFRAGEEPNVDVIRLLTAEEVAIVNKAVEEVQADYQKRLDTYYKKYADKVRVSGYWVNR